MLNYLRVAQFKFRAPSTLASQQRAVSRAEEQSELALGARGLAMELATNPRDTAAMIENCMIAIILEVMRWMNVDDVHLRKSNNIVPSILRQHISPASRLVIDQRGLMRYSIPGLNYIILTWVS